jgi:hypothetical protein
VGRPTLPTGLIEHWPAHPTRHVCHWRRRRSGARFVFSVAIVSTV